MFPNYIVKLVLSTLIHKIGVDDFVQFLAELCKVAGYGNSRQTDTLAAYELIDAFVDKYLNK